MSRFEIQKRNLCHFVLLQFCSLIRYINRLIFTYLFSRPDFRGITYHHPWSRGVFYGNSLSITVVHFSPHSGNYVENPFTESLYIVDQKWPPPIKYSFERVCFTWRIRVIILAETLVDRLCHFFKV